MRGIDVSEGNGNINFNEVKKNGIEAVMIKATEGVTYNDSKFLINYKNAKAAGLKVGAYHYLRKNDPSAEAKHFISVLGNLQFDLKYMIDSEDNTLKNDKYETSTRIRQFADYLINKGKETGVYTYTSFYKNYMDERVSSLPLWIAEYGVKKPNITSQYVGFQYSETGIVPGISTKTDLDEFYDGFLIGGKLTNNTAASTVSTNDYRFFNGYNVNRVKSLQQLINGLGIKDNSSKALVVDGKLGPRTLEAMSKLPIAKLKGYHNAAYTDWIEVQFGQKPDNYFGPIMDGIIKNFQKNHGLTVDGMVGINTLKEILKLS